MKQYCRKCRHGVLFYNSSIYESEVVNFLGKSKKVISIQLDRGLIVATTPENLKIVGQLEGFTVVHEHLPNSDLFQSCS